MIDVSQHIQAAYDQMVEEYARRNHAGMTENLIILAEQLLHHAGPRAHVLDVGCGTGRDMAWLEGRGATVTGIDLSANMLAFARRHVTGALLQMKMQTLAFSTNHFDGIWCCASLLHLPKQEAPVALKEMRRVLKSAHPLMLSIQAGRGERWEAGYVAGVYRFFARYTSDEMAAMLDQSGFSVQAIETSQAGARQWLSFMCLAH